jgi:hypothetical protein
LKAQCLAAMGVLREWATAVGGHLRSAPGNLSERFCRRDSRMLQDGREMSTLHGSSPGYDSFRNWAHSGG